MTIGAKAETVNDQTEEQSNENENQNKHWDPLIDGVKWIEKYSDTLDKYFQKLPDILGTIVATFAVFTFGAILRGEWVVILVTALKQITGQTQTNSNFTTTELFSHFTAANLKMENFSTIFIIAHVVSYSIYFIIGGFLHWYYYINRRHKADEWKIQKDKWITPELEREEIYMGVLALFVTGSFSAFLATYIMNGNPSTVYYQFDEYGWWWFLLQFIVLYIYTDYTTYLMHRLYHTRFLYVHFHKMHHRYRTPTMFSTTAIHPVEIMHVQLTMCLPLFTIPTHWLPFYSIAIYNFYHGILDHSGINFKAQWWQPWQPDAEFHDLHHQLTHCNFGFNMSLWDKLHGTMRVPTKLYSEEIYHGEAPEIDSEEAKKLAEKYPEAKANLLSAKALLNTLKDETKKTN